MTTKIALRIVREHRNFPHKVSSSNDDMTLKITWTVLNYEGHGFPSPDFSGQHISSIFRVEE
jgi:hypothetical protein